MTDLVQKDLDGFKMMLDPSRSSHRFGDATLYQELKDSLSRIFELGYMGTAEDGVSFASAAEMLMYIHEHQGKSGAPNFLLIQTAALTKARQMRYAQAF